jgi:hypothetical protein
MSEFVNYKKRGVELPPGCKNLSDVLKAKGALKHLEMFDWNKWVDPPGKSRPMEHNESLLEGKISDVERFVAKVFQSSAKLSSVAISCPASNLQLDVARVPDGSIEAGVAVQVGTDLEKAVRAFFTHHHLEIPSHVDVRPPMFPGGLPWTTTYHISPMPDEAAALSKLLAELMRSAFGVTDDSTLLFRYSEFKEKAGPEP